MVRKGLTRFVGVSAATGAAGLAALFLAAGPASANPNQNSDSSVGTAPRAAAAKTAPLFSKFKPLVLKPSRPGNSTTTAPSLTGARFFANYAFLNYAVPTSYAFSNTTASPSGGLA